MYEANSCEAEEKFHFSKIVPRGLEKFFICFSAVVSTLLSRPREQSSTLSQHSTRDDDGDGGLALTDAADDPNYEKIINWATLTLQKAVRSRKIPRHINYFSEVVRQKLLQITLVNLRAKAHKFLKFMVELKKFFSRDEETDSPKENVFLSTGNFRVEWKLFT